MLVNAVQIYAGQIYAGQSCIALSGRRLLSALDLISSLQLQSDWAQMQVIELRNDGAGFGFGISGSRNSGAVVRNIFPGGAADRVSLTSHCESSIV